MKSQTLQWTGMFFIFQLGLLHFLTAQNDYLKAPYLGYLAMLFFLGALIAVFGIYHKQVWGWAVGILVSFSSMLVFVWGRTLGLPTQAVEPWFYPFGLVEAALAGLFIILVMIRPWKRSVSIDGQSINHRWFPYLIPALSIISIAGVSYSTYEWDLYARVVGYHRHVGSLAVVCNTPLTSFGELEKLYGLKMVQMNISMMNSIVDVRLIVTDPEKARSLLQDQGALLVNREVLVLGPHQHTHWLLRKDQALILFFPTMNNTIRPGSEVSLVLGRVRVEPLIIK